MLHKLLIKCANSGLLPMSTLDLKRKLQEEHLAQIRNNFLIRRHHQHAPQTDNEIDGKRASTVTEWFKLLAWYCPN